MYIYIYIYNQGTKRQSTGVNKERNPSAEGSFWPMLSVHMGSVKPRWGPPPWKTGVILKPCGDCTKHVYWRCFNTL